MRRPQLPRRARRLLAPITSPPVAGFSTYGRLAAPTLHNEAESGSLVLRLTGSPREASPGGLLRLTLARLPVEWAIDRVSSFQPTRSARLILALHRLSFMCAPHCCVICAESGWPGVATVLGRFGRPEWGRHTVACLLGYRTWAALLPTPLNQDRHMASCLPPTDLLLPVPDPG
jgi:hypothetical protein